MWGAIAGAAASVMSSQKKGGNAGGGGSSKMWSDPQFKTREQRNDTLSKDMHSPQRSKDPYK